MPGQSVERDAMYFTGGGGWLILLGAPFVLSAGIMLASPFWGPFKSPNGERVPLLAALPLAALFGVVGLGLMLGRCGRILDRRSGALTQWWGLLTPMHSTIRPLSDFHEVTLSREARISSNHKSKRNYTIYPVRLRSASGAAVVLDESRDPLHARRVAEGVVKFLGIPLLDNSLGQPLLRKAHEVDESLRERVRRTGEKPPIPTAPPDGRTRATVQDDTLVLDIPATGLTRLHALRLASMLVPLLFVGVGLSMGDVPLEVRVTFALLWAIPFVIACAAVACDAWTNTVVDLNSERISVKRCGLLGRRTTVIPADELEELLIIGPEKSAMRQLLGDTDKIVVRSDRASASFGMGLSRTELEWLRDVVKNVATY